MIEEDKNWLEENKTAIDNYNERIERDGIFGSCKRRF
ncbi:MAG: type II toxin-antitoxin system CcdA family antitoxin [Pedobacter sp.]